MTTPTKILESHDPFLMGVVYSLQTGGFRRRQTLWASSGQATGSSSINNDGFQGFINFKFLSELAKLIMNR